MLRITTSLPGATKQYTGGELVRSYCVYRTLEKRVPSGEREDAMLLLDLVLVMRSQRWQLRSKSHKGRQQSIGPQ